jgi:quinol monooxygenase YgiN
MHIMEARTILFRDFGSDHRSTLFGDVSQDFVDLVTQRMGPPTVYTFMHGLEPSATVDGGARGHLEVIARLKVRPGQLEGFRAQTAELVRLTRELDTHTLRYDWFINADASECEVHEAYTAEEGLVEHNAHIVAARELLFEKYAYDHRMSVYGSISDHLAGLFEKHAGGVDVYSFVEGLQAAPAV